VNDRRGGGPITVLGLIDALPATIASLVAGRAGD
jgi:hypothetical protein